MGDYHSFDVAGASFFVVLAGDQKLRAFHNICRHRAYQVIRKPCGNSTRFSCRYHGWQYNDHGGLVKAPKFENMPGFVPAENGLFEIKLILTKEGLVFVNFDSSTMGMPFSGVKSQMLVPDLHWRESFSFTTNLNWKGIGEWRFMFALTRANENSSRLCIPSQLVTDKIRLGPAMAEAKALSAAWSTDHPQRVGRRRVGDPNSPADQREQD